MSMKIIVCVKTNMDLQMVRVKNREPVLEAIPYKVGNLEKNALEAAIQIKEGGTDVTVVALTVAEANSRIRETMKEVLAIGADEAVIVADPALAATDQAAVAVTIARAVEQVGGADLLFFGEGSTDNYSGQVGSRVAQILGMPQVGYARKLELSGSAVRAERIMDDMVETLEATLPVVVTVVSEINEPRIPSLMNIMKAGKKLVTELSLADLGLDAASAAPQKTILSNLAEKQDRKHIMLEGDASSQAAGLIDALVREGVLGR
jgi:electron transfer flavoprotein beta subunit